MAWLLGSNLSLAVLARALGRSVRLDQMLELSSEEALKALKASTTSISALKPGTGALHTIINVGGQYRSGIAWVRVQPGSDLATSTVKRQGYVGIDGNLHYPAIATTKQSRYR